MIRSMTWFGLGIIVALACPSAMVARAQTSYWNVGSGNWNTPGNWSPPGVPGNSANVNIVDSDGMSRTVTYNYTGAAVTLSYLDIELSGGSGSATNTLSMSANNLTVSNNELVGVYGTGTFTQTGGTNTITGGIGLTVGANSGSNGSYMLSGTGSLSCSSTETIGDDATGTFTQTSGTNTTTLLVLGGSSGSNGRYTLMGGTLNCGATGEQIQENGIFNQSGGTNNISNSGIDSLYVGFGSNGSYMLSGTGVLSDSGGELLDGHGTFTQTGGTNTIGLGLIVANGGPDNCTYTLGGTGSLNVTGNNEIIGDTTGTGSFIQTGGTNTITGSNVLIVGADGSIGTYTLSGGSVSAANVYVGSFPSEPADGQGFLTVSGTGSLTTPGALVVYNTSGTLLTLSGGTINAGSLNLSGNPSRFNWTGGTLNLTNSSVELDTSANAWNGFSSLTLNSGMALGVSGVETIGGSGTGSLTESGGNNTIHGADALTLGGSHGSTGTYSFSGGTLRSFGFEYVGFDGTGNFNQSAGTNEINFGYSLYVGYGADSNGTYTLSGSGSLISSANEYVGEAGIGNFNQSGGSNLLSGGGVLSIAQQAGSSSSYALSGGTLSAGGIYVGGSDSGAGGTGVLTVSGSGSLASSSTITVYNTPGSGFNVNGGAVNATALNLMGTYMHTDGNATYGHITGGGQMSVSGGQVILTDDTTGHLASVSVGGPATLGFDIGTSSSSQITADTATFNATPTLAFTLSGYPNAGTVFTLLSATQLNDNGNLGSLPAQAVVIGRDTLTPSFTGGSGAAGAIIVTVSGGPANLTWIGSNNIGVDTGGAWDTQTTHNWDNHSNEALTPDLFYAGDHVTFDDTAANFIVDLNSGNVIANSVTFNNSLNAYTVNGFSGIAGSTNVTFAGSNSVTLNNYNSYTGTTTISGGGLVSIAGSIASPTINVTHGTLQLAADNGLTGTPIVTLGNGTTTGTLDLDGTNTNTVGELSGGAGNLVTNSNAAPATLIFASGSSTFGGTIQDGNSGGQVALNISSGSLTLSGANTYTGGTMVNGGTLAVNGSILGNVAVNFGAALAGHGSVGGMVSVSFGGFLSPGNGPTSTGALTLSSLTLYSGSQTNIKLAGITPGSQYDQIQVTGQLSLDGILQVSLVNSFTPAVGNTFDILTWPNGGLIGTFATLQLPALSGAEAWDTSQLYTTGALTVTATYLPGDINRDGQVTVADIQALMVALSDFNAYLAANPDLKSNPQLLLQVADVNGDGKIDNTDLQALINLVANNAASGGGGQLTAVPEPATIVLFGLGALAIAFCRRSR